MSNNKVQDPLLAMLMQGDLSEVLKEITKEQEQKKVDKAFKKANHISIGYEISRVVIETTTMICKTCGVEHTITSSRPFYIYKDLRTGRECRPTKIVGLDMVPEHMGVSVMTKQIKVPICHHCSNNREEFPQQQVELTGAGF